MRPMAKHDSKPKPRWMRFSLRTMFVLVTILGVWIGWQASAARQQKHVVTAILNAGGSVNYDYQLKPWSAFPSWTGTLSLQQQRQQQQKSQVLQQLSGPADGYFDSEAIPPGPKWLREKIGDDYFCNAICLRMSCPSQNPPPPANYPTPAAAKFNFDELDKLPRLNALALFNYDRLDEKLDVLARLPELEALNFSNSNFNGSALAKLPNPERIRTLTLTRSDVDDAALQCIGRMTGLRELDLCGTRVTDAGLIQLRNLAELRRLDLRDTLITAEGLKRLAGLTLVNLDVAGSKVTLASLAELQTLFPTALIRAY
jgi:hypothetical protein